LSITRAVWSLHQVEEVYTYMLWQKQKIELTYKTFFKLKH
jgi:hypothetical protein